MRGDEAHFLDRDMVGGLEKGLAVIEAFDRTRPRLTLTEVAERTGLTRAAARRYLLTLTKLGYAEHDGKFFSLSPKILRLGYAFLSASPLPARVQPFLERISAAVGESSSAAVLDDTEVVYIARSATRRIMSISLNVGSRLPAYCTSLGRVLLAHRSPEWLDYYFHAVPLEPLTPKTRTSEAQIRRALAEMRRHGYALVDEELELGLVSLAVPIFDGAGRVVCAINVSVQAARVSREEALTRILPALAAAQDDLRPIL